VPLGASPQSNRFVSNSGGGGGGSTQAPRTRSFFPETWIWEDMESSDGTVILNKTVPDTITSWFISAFQLDPKTGISLSSNQPQLTVFRPFFIALNLPYSIVRGEVLGLQILVHNYLEKPVNATVTLENPDQSFKFIESDAPKEQMVKTVEVPASSISSVTFPITALKFGTLNLKAKATTLDAGDAVSRPIIVKPPGIKHVQNNAVFVNLISSPTFEQKSLGAVFPDTRVKDADFLKVSVIGDILGGTLNNLDKLIKLPKGCGEQNMVNFVPDIVVLDYLKKTKALTPEIKRRAVNYLEKGYQQQLTYLRYDGSFSSFGNSDPTGSTWLTAFVTRAFVQARKYITIDEEVINKSLRFLVRQQNDNGSFSEDGFVYDKSLVGGAGSPENQLSLTAFTLLTFVEAQKEGMTLAEFKNASSIIDNGIKFILSHNSTVKQSNDPYAANLISYLLHLSDNPAKEEFFKITEDLAKVDIENGTIHWEQITRQKPQRNDTGIIKPSWRYSSFDYYYG
jgi:CD109 antigen